MRVGILTFHDADNFGAVLQTYALYKSICMIADDADVKIINYKCEKVLDNMSFRENVKKRGLIKAIYKYPQFISIHKKFNNFRRQYLPLTEELNSIIELQELTDKYDVIISGSDQVWNLKLTGNDSVYYQSFYQKENKKYSYAASMGVYWFEQGQVEKYRKILSEFACISLREETTADKFKDLGLSVRTDLDPTLLLGREGWNVIASDKFVNKKYIALYMVPYQKEVVERAFDIQKRTGLPIILLSKSREPKSATHAGNMTPEEFIGAIRDAEYVVTNSFHGTAFSIMFHRKFCIYLQTPHGYNFRSYDFLADIGIMSGEKDLICEKENVNWKTVDEKILYKKNESIDYLQSIVKTEFANNYK